MVEKIKYLADDLSDPETDMPNANVDDNSNNDNNNNNGESTNNDLNIDDLLGGGE